MDTKLPLKKVVITNADYFRPPGGGGNPKVFGPVTTDVRNRLASELNSVKVHFQDVFQRYPKAAVVGRVVLKDEALAKSHRPLPLLEKADCSIIGVGGFGELLVSLQPTTINRLQHVVQSETSKVAEANISTIRAIEPFAIGEPSLNLIRECFTKAELITLKLRLFHHHDHHTNETLKQLFLAELASQKIEYEKLTYAPGIDVYRLHRIRHQHAQQLMKFIGTQSLGPFPEYHVVRPTAQPVGRLTPAQFPAPEAGIDYPVVGIVDTGIDPSNPFIAPWVVGREEFVHVAERDYEHGTFVGGLVVHARAMNHNNTQFPRSPCRLLDVVALPKSGRISEDELLAILQEVIPKYPKIKIWNLSLGGAVPCSDHAFSDFSIALDELQTTSGVTFVLAAGNYSKAPFRAWPPPADLGEADRICAPADSARALTVGSIAHRDSPASRVLSSLPSPFSRRGPGPVYLPKPEVAHFGGNCDAAGGHAQIGVLSIDARGNLAESIGTSFAAPIVASLLAQVQSAPVEPLSNLMAKTLVIHSAVLANPDITEQQINYRGFGIPSDPIDILGCEPWRATMLFEGNIQAGLDLERKPFPIPNCLRTTAGTFRGELTVTLVYAPPLNGAFGAEYCRSNIDVSLGIFEPDNAGDSTYVRQVPPHPKRTNTKTHEKTLVEQGFKWSPVKVYRRQVPRGITGQAWRLVVAATDRSGAENVSIPVAIAVTIADIDRKAPVYNDTVTAMAQMGWTTMDVVLRPRTRSRVA